MQSGRGRSLIQIERWFTARTPHPRPLSPQGRGEGSKHAANGFRQLIQRQRGQCDDLHIAIPFGFVERLR